MNHLQWYDFLRMVTTACAFFACYVSAKRAMAQWDAYTDRLRGLVWLLQGLLFLLGEGSIEQIVMDVPWGPRTLIGFILAAGGLRIILKKEGFLRPDKELPPA